MADLVIVTTILDDESDAQVLAAKAVSDRLAARGQVSPPLQSVRRAADGTVETLTECRVDLECTQNQVIALSLLVQEYAGMSAPFRVTPILEASNGYSAWIRRATR